MTASSSGNSPCCGFERVSRTYDIQAQIHELEAHWSPDDDQVTVGDIMAAVNRAVVRTALEATGAQVLHGEAKMLVEAITCDHPKRQQQARERIQFQGVDVETLEADLLSRQVVQTHLRNHVDPDSTPTRDGPAIPDPGDEEYWQRHYSDEYIEAYNERQVETIIDWIDALAQHGVLPHANYAVNTTTDEITSPVDIVCNVCETHRRFWVLFTDGCDCGGGTDGLPNDT